MFFTIFDDNQTKKKVFHRYARPFNLDNFIEEVTKKINCFENSYKYLSVTQKVVVMILPYLI